MMPRQAIIDVDNISRTLIIGDSMIRGISERGLQNTTVRPLSGARVSDVVDEVRTIKSSMKGYGNVILHVGTNNCTTSEGVDIAVTDYRRLLSELRHISPAVTPVVSTVCPRKDSTDNQMRVDRLNLAIKELAKNRGCRVVDHDNNFKMKDDSVDSSLLDKGGFHLTQAGTLRLLRNFQAALPAIIRSRGRVQTTHTCEKRRTPTPKRLVGNRRNGHADGLSSRGNRYHKSRKLNSHRPSTTANDSCEYCGENNHLASRCKFEEPLICHNCFGLGHKSWMCTVVRSKSRTRRDRKV